MKSRFFFYAVSTMALFAFTCCSGGLKVVNLSCEYMTEPMGIDVSAPQFSWQLADAAFTRGQKQTGYQILVASSPSLLNEKDADVWNSGKVASDKSVFVSYTGAKLASSRAYYWKVQVWDKDGAPIGWSRTARFVTGIMDKAEWKTAEWIVHPSAPHTKHIWFRKNFTLDGGVSSKEIFAHVASLGYHELYINGKKVDDNVLSPVLTDYQKRLFYVTYDISPFLRKGANTVAIWFAAGWASYDCFNMTPCLKVKLVGEKVDINSDTSWLCAESNSEDTEKTRSFDHNGGEIVDARYAVPDWNSVKFNDTNWTSAAITPGYNDEWLEPQMIEGSKVIETIKAKSVTEVKEGVYKVDFGKNF
ncbi:MAG: alpha-L-rhamnosidase N-terminal domain-containing protein, partial [Tannerella sp.]|nr:alpha-L-rhamnosidase N-terminal domain-containing protein [Tannerella sp.]